MWNLFNQRRELKTEVYGKLRPGDLFGGEHQTGRQPEDLVRYLLLANAVVLTFFGVVLTRVDPGAGGHEEIYSAVWLAGVGILIAAGSWLLFRLSRSGEAKLLGRGLDGVEAESLTADVKKALKGAAIKKLLGFRIMIVSAISGCIALYTGLKGLFLL
jgi:hypothetical protein